MKRGIYLIVGLLLLVSFSQAQINTHGWDFKDSVFTGKATWYGAALQGNLTASGERFDYRKFTAAHKFLPMGTYLKVTNLENERSLIVKVNDRLPHTSSPIIDLSRASAEELGFRKQGVTKVRLEVLQIPPHIPDLWVDMWLGIQASAEK